MSHRNPPEPPGGPRDTVIESEVVVALIRALVVLVVLLAPAVVGLRRSPGLTWLTIVAVVYAAGVAVLLRFRLELPGRRVAELVVDVILVTFLVCHDGELRPQAFAFYYLVVISAAAWLGVAGAVGAAALCSLAATFAVMMFVAEELRFGQLQSILLPQVLQIFMVAVLCSFLAEAWQAERAAAREQRAIVDEFRQQINMARELQSILLPAKLPRVPGLDLGVRARQADVVVGGDFYDGVAFSDGALGLCCADVSGKSVPGQLRLPLVKYAFRVCAAELREPGAVMTRLDRLLYEELPPEMYVSMVYALVEPGAGVLTIANAGHCYPLHQSAAGGAVRPLVEIGPPLGIDPRDRSRTQRIELAPDDFLLFYTDGVIEAKGRRNRELEVDGLVKLLDQTTPESAQDLCNLLFQALEEYEIGAKRDDLTLLAIRRTSVP